MKITYCMSPIATVNQFTMSSRILTSNLLRNDKLDVSFNYSSLECHKIYNDKLSSIIDPLTKLNYNMGINCNAWYEWIKFFIIIKEYRKKFVDSLKTDIVLMSCLYGNLDFPFVVEMLNSGKKVLLGGSNFNFINENDTKKYLLGLGVKKEYLKNMIIVQGIVDLTTDLYQIIKNWKSVKIENNDFSTIWECDDDYFQNIIRTSSSILKFNPYNSNAKNNFALSVFLLNNKCWYGKCKFCTYKKLPVMDFDKGVSPEAIANNILRVNKKFGSNTIWICNDYFTFNKKNKEVLKILKNNNQKVSIFTGVKLLQNDKFLDNINEYIDYIKIGAEAGTDFALKYVSKGYSIKDIYNVFDRLNRKAKKSLFISYNIIVDLPQLNEKEIIRNYKNALEWKNMLSGFEVQTCGLSFAIFNYLNDVCVDNKFVKRVEKATSGRSYVFDTLRKLFEFDETLYGNLIPFERYDEDGNALKSDFEIIPKDIADGLFGNWGWKE